MTTRPRFEFLDGLRGFSAILVTLHHAKQAAGAGAATLLPILHPLNLIFKYGYYSVPVFIVLSGFSLSIPVALDGNKELRGGIKSYFFRRARRILPAYYAALVLSMLLLYAGYLIQARDGKEMTFPFSLFDVIAHLGLFHNISYEYIYTINGPMWSVATEWQIYFAFPVMLWVWRRFNLTVALGISVILGVTARVFLDITAMHPWYLGLFAFGMLASIVVFSPDPFWNRARWFASKQIFGYLTALSFLLFVGMVYAGFGFMTNEIVLGWVVALALIFLTKREIDRKNNMLLSILKSNMLVWFGVWSYSIYLAHSPILSLIKVLTNDLKVSDSERFVFMIFIAAPVSLVFSYFFHITCEKRFLGNRKPENRDSVAVEIKAEVAN